VKRIDHTVILAAGRGQRMMPVTQLVPKAMLPYLQSTLVAHGIDKIRPHIRNIHVTVGYKGAMLAQHLIEHDVTSIHNTDGQSNSWWIHNTLLRCLDEPVFVLTCDNVTDLDFGQLAEDYFRLGEPPCLLVPVEPVAHVTGDYIFHDGPVVQALDRNKPAETYCSGIQVLNPARVAELTSGTGDFMTVWQELMAKQLLFVSSVRPNKWFSVDTLDDLQTCAAMMGSE
jgi:NDP-sugar pyrophosphorylase family protein